MGSQAPLKGRVWGRNVRGGVHKSEESITSAISAIFVETHSRARLGRNTVKGGG